MRDKEDTWSYSYGPIVVWAIVMLLFLLTVGFTGLLLHKHEQVEKDANVQRANVCNSNDYTFYLEGNEVDFDKIRIENYSYDFDDENKTVILY